jgi:Predicted dehydrogenases and related proteins
MSPDGTVRIAVAGAGLIGKRHIEEVDASASARLASIIDPGPAGPELAQKYGVPLHGSLAELFEKDRPDGVILATPTRCMSTAAWNVWRPGCR